MLTEGTEPLSKSDCTQMSLIKKEKKKEDSPTDKREEKPNLSSL